jgi:acetyl esterase/lipase
MKFHHFAEPKPPTPNFKIVIPSRLSPRGGTFKLVFYVPESYFNAPDGYRFPVVVNFHGGGFTLGTATDDARWASTVIQEVGAVFVSVEYRLAPEYPFSVGVEDGTDAVIYLALYAEELRLDAHRMALSGFSAGGNLTFTVPIMLYDLQNDAGKRNLADCNDPNKQPGASKSSSTLSLPRLSAQRASPTDSILKLSDLEPTVLEINQNIPNLTLKAIVSFYPPTDFRQSREEKRATNPAPEKNLPEMLTNLFDESYFHPADLIDFTDPYLSPAAASDKLLKAAYPDDIVLYTCEYDMLNAEGVAFGERLSGSTIGKTLHGGLIKAAPHAFDKKPNPIHFPKAADRCYSEACAELRRVFGTGRSTPEERRQLDKSERVDRFEEDDQRERLSDDTTRGDEREGNDNGR